MVLHMQDLNAMEHCMTENAWAAFSIMHVSRNGEDVKDDHVGMF